MLSEMASLKQNNEKQLIRSFVENTIIENQNNDNNVIVVTTGNAKIDRLIEEIRANYNRKQIVILLMEIADKPDICENFNISLPHYLSKYLLCQEEIVLSEVGVFILCAAKIYSRRIDCIHKGIESMITGIKKNQEKEKATLEAKNKDKQEKDSLKVIKRPPKRSLPTDNELYESEIEPKSFKKGSDEKICDKKLIEYTFEPPKNYFRNFKRYLEYRGNNKKIKKDSSQHEENADPSLYQYSTIEDFDYEEDMDSKRNYRSLHGHMEHRYSTIVSDINFRMHFKVKDFIEEIESDILLGEESKKRKYCSLHEDKYINLLLELENDAIEKEYNGNNTISKKTKVLTDSLDSNCKTMSNNCSVDMVDKLGTETQNIDPSLTVNNNTIELENKNQSNSIEKESAIINTTEKVDDLSINVEDSSNVDNDDDREIIDPKKIRVRLNSEDEGIYFSDFDDVQYSLFNPKVVAVDIRNSIDKIENLRIKLDSKIEAFLGVDDREKEDDENSFCPKNILGINKEILQCHEDFTLPSEFFIRETPIIYNIFKFAEKRLRAKKMFSLPEEFNLYKSDRLKKRIPLEKPPRSIRDFKFDLHGNCSTPLSILNDVDFNGFTEEDRNAAFLYNQINDLDVHRKISTDSGIGIARGFLTSCSRIDESDLHSDANYMSSTLISTAVDSGFFNSTEENNVSNINSTLNDNNLSKLSDKIDQIEENNIQYSSKVLAVTLIKPADIHNNCDNENSISDGFSNDENFYEFDNTSENNRVKDWHKQLKPILANSKDRHHFDIYELGTQIMDKFSKNNKTTNFQSVMEDKEPSSTTRCLLSMLLLANAGNVKINVKNKNSDEPTAPEDIEIVLLNRERHNVSVEDNIGIINNRHVIQEEITVDPAEVSLEEDKSEFFRKPNKIIKTKGNEDDSGFFSSSNNSISSVNVDKR